MDHKKCIALDPQFLGDKKVKQTKATRTNYVTVEVKPEDNVKFKEIVIAEMAQSLKVESSAIAMYAATLKDNPNQWIFFEIYANDTTDEALRKTSHFKDYIVKTEAMLKDKGYIKLSPGFLGNRGNLFFQP